MPRDALGFDCFNIVHGLKQELKQSNTEKEILDQAINSK
jgi:hypothetical protein